MWPPSFQQTIHVSMPRRAMQELGFQACCLWCDAPDAGSETRCGSCIRHHRNVRERLGALPGDDPLGQLAKEIMAMGAAPHQHDHDEVHGAVLREQQRRAGALGAKTTAPTGEDIAALFSQQRSTKKANVLRDVGNQNDPNQQPPTPTAAQKIGETVLPVDPSLVEQYGARTVPSQPIAPVNRDERPGEDTALTDRVHAASMTDSTLGDETAEIFEAIEFQQRQQQRKELKRALSDVRSLVDDDLDF
ncbi:hypothetical protein N8392_00905 [Candidatus Poseidonia sp.]|nr:hypothetical protein [Poseidonia sp.]